jgi:hypothetical protein
MFDIIYYVCMIVGIFLLTKYSNMQTAAGVLLIATAVRFMDYKDRKGGD